jgi:hypothetical protein
MRALSSVKSSASVLPTPGGSISVCVNEVRTPAPMDTGGKVASAANAVSAGKDISAAPTAAERRMDLERMRESFYLVDSVVTRRIVMKTRATPRH